jgi:hypothetical protein
MKTCASTPINVKVNGKHVTHYDNQVTAEMHVQLSYKKIIKITDKTLNIIFVLQFANPAMAFVVEQNNKEVGCSRICTSNSPNTTKYHVAYYYLGFQNFKT